MTIRDLEKEATCDFCGRKEWFPREEAVPEKWRVYQVMIGGPTTKFEQPVHACVVCRHDTATGSSEMPASTFDERMQIKRQRFWRRLFGRPEK